MLGFRELSLVFCDDDETFRELLRRTAQAEFRRGEVPIRVTEASSGPELLALAEHSGFDLIFLDIDMPGMDGIRLGAALRAAGSAADIIYVSNMEDKVYEIFRVHPWSFVRKSRLTEELPGVIAEYLESLRHRGRGLIVTDVAGRTHSFTPEEIVYIEAAGKNQKIFTVRQAEPILDRISMQALDEMCRGLGFIRIHKGFLVNYRFIRKITSRSVILDDGRDLPVGRDRLNDARERYLFLMKWKGLSRPVPEPPSHGSEAPEGR